TRKVELTTWNDTGNVEKWRENFSDLCNKYLERAGAEKRVDHRSFKRQNSDYLPTIHLGSAASAMESEIQKEKSKYLKGYAKTNKEKYDFKKLTSAYSYLRKNNIETIGQLQTKIETLKSNSYRLNKKAKTIHKEMEDVE
ncbi:MobA/MobL family protein, partial [Streptococcus pneumoniae]|uniref:MobA/MobL family protein n=1 Tax=Streptococcus pneumoniae TaxID=1313 RepID=UPI000A89CFB1